MRTRVRWGIVLVCLAVPASVGAQTRVMSAVAACGAASDKTLSSNGDSFTCGVEGFASARLQTLDTYSGTWEVQCSVDGGTTFDTDDELMLTLLGASASVASVTDTVGIWDVNVAGCTQIKVIATAGFAASDTTFAFRGLATGGGAGAGSSGSVTQGTDPWIVAGGGTAGAAATGVVTVQGIASGTAVTVAPSSGTFATDNTVDAAIGTTGPLVLCDGNSSAPTAVTAGRPQYVWCDLNGRVQTNIAYWAGAAPGATNPVITTGFPGTLVQGVNASAMTGTTSTSIVSGTASNYLYITSCVVSNGSTTVSTNILLQDGNGGTTIGRIPAPAAAVATTGGGGATHTFGAPLKVPTSGNAMYAANETTGASTYITCTGYRSTVSY